MFVKVKLVVVLLSAAVVLYGLVGGTMEKVSAREGGVYGDLAVFTDVIRRVNEDYVEKPNLQKAMLGAVHGMLEALDPYSSFVDRATYEKLSQLTAAASPGIILSKRYGYAYIVSVAPGSPAERQGLRTGDLLESIDGRVTTEMSLWEAERLLWGKPGTTVTVRAIRARRTEPVQMDLAREEIPPRPATARIVEDGIGLLKIPNLEEGAFESVQSKLKTMQSTGIQGLLVDLRGTATGTLEEATKVADLFLEKGKKIVTVKDREGKTTDFVSLNDRLVANIPIAVMVDGGTSGAAEVLAAALQDHKVASIIGERTNGRGSIQEPFTLGDGSVLLISTRLYYRSAGKPIQEQNLRNSGITPDVRSPDEDFVTNFYFDNMSDEPDQGFDEEFYRKLNSAVDAEQFRSGLKYIRERVLKEAA
ncbi:MAG TPA: S41 family peptidase [Acidobacteriota bacterium]|nr:S41 family peptidase [Acidobacteriota bacterium]